MTVWQYFPATAHRILKGLYVRSKALLCLLKSYLANPALPLILKYHPKSLIYSLVIFVLCIPFSTTASVFFQQSLITETDKGLSVHVDKVEASTLLNAWCEVCHKNCIMKHDTKIKVNIHEDHISCHELLTDLLTTTQLQLIQNQDRLVFLPPQKREWITYSFQNRSAHEVATLLAKLSPKQSLFADKVNNNLWMPYDFYQQHAAAIKQLDTPNHCYQILLSLVHINEQHSQHPEDTGTNQALSWLKDYLAPIEWQQAISWLLMLEQKRYDLLCLAIYSTMWYW